MRWTVLIFAGWGVLLGLSAIQSNLPASWWLDVGRVDVTSTDDADGCFPMEVDRGINRPFFAEWVVTIMRRSGSGYYTYRTYQGANDYRPVNTLPDDLDLCWWAGVESIVFTEGEYRVHTLWKLQVDGGTREIRRRSSAFKVEPVS